jgi:hypothetical protein
MDAVDVVVDLAVAVFAAVFAGVLLLRGRRTNTVTLGGWTVHQAWGWAMAALLVGVALALRVAIGVAPAGWRPALTAVTLLATAAAAVVSGVAVARSPRR